MVTRLALAGRELSLIRGRGPTCLLLGAGLLGLVILALSKGQDTNWDLLNYHLYNPYAWLHDRYDIDLLPPGLQTFFTPYLDIAYFWLTESLSPRMVTLTLALAQSVNLILLFLICRLTLISQKIAPSYALLLAALGILSVGFLSELGTTMNDSLVGVLTLSSLLLILSALKKPLESGPCLLLVALGGLVAGAACGLKLTVGIYALAPKAIMINRRTLTRLNELQQDFDSAKPFRHLALDNFFDEEIAQRLLDQFPSFEAKHALNEFGEVGNKAVVTDLAQIGEAYERTYDYLNSPEFLDVMTQLTGIPDLLPDPGMYGGGTHENLEGQNLFPHVDFNYSRDRRFHRRLNVLIYLNDEWEESWGGCLQLHSDPHDPTKDQIKTFLPLFNRAVLFETNEHSWHGFRTIRLPEEKKHLSRKCISIYLYTKERPAEEIVPEHGTFYVLDHLPDYLQAGYTLSAGDLETLEELLQERDDFITYYQNLEMEKNRAISESIRYRERIEEAIRLPITGYVLQAAPAQGFWHDNWISEQFSVELRAKSPVQAITFHGVIPERAVHGYHLTFTIAGETFERYLSPGNLSMTFNLNESTSGKLDLTISAPRKEIDDAALEPGGRPLLFLLKELEFHHGHNGDHDRGGEQHQGVTD